MLMISSREDGADVFLLAVESWQGAEHNRSCRIGWRRQIGADAARRHLAGHGVQLRHGDARRRRLSRRPVDLHHVGVVQLPTCDVGVDDGLLLGGSLVAQAAAIDGEAGDVGRDVVRLVDVLAEPERDPTLRLGGAEGGGDVSDLAVLTLWNGLHRARIRDHDAGSGTSDDLTIGTELPTALLRYDTGLLRGGSRLRN